MEGVEFGVLLPDGSMLVVTSELSIVEKIVERAGQLYAMRPYTPMTDAAIVSAAVNVFERLGYEPKRADVQEAIARFAARWGRES